MRSDLAPKAVTTYKAIGERLKVNGEAIYGTRANPLPTIPDWGNISISKDGRSLYLHVMKWMTMRLRSVASKIILDSGMAQFALGLYESL